MNVPDSSIFSKDFKIQEEDPIAKLLNKAVLKDDEIPCKLVQPSPGFCVKTHSMEGDKIFMNICYTDDIPEPEDLSDAELIEILESDEPSAFRVPMSIGNKHTEVDRRGNLCSVYDIAINTQFFSKVFTNQLFQTFFITVVMEGLMEKYSLELTLKDPKPFHIVKNRKCLGTLQQHRIQQRPVKKNVPLIQELPYVSPYTKLENVKPTMKEVPNEKVKDEIFELKRAPQDAQTVKKDTKKKPLIEEITPEEYRKLTSNIKVIKSRNTNDFIKQSLNSISELPEKMKSLDTDAFQSSENPLAVNEHNRIRIFGVPNHDNPRSIVAFLKLKATSCQEITLEVGDDHVVISENNKDVISFGLPLKLNVESAQAIYSVDLQVLKVTIQPT